MRAQQLQMELQVRPDTAMQCRVAVIADWHVGSQLACWHRVERNGFVEGLSGLWWSGNCLEAATAPTQWR